VLDLAGRYDEPAHLLVTLVWVLRVALVAGAVLLGVFSHFEPWFIAPLALLTLLPSGDTIRRFVIVRGIGVSREAEKLNIVDSE
jgi:hypothetical protein